MCFLHFCMIRYIMGKQNTAECLGGYTTLKYLRRCEGFITAKEHGDLKAANHIIEKCVTEESMQSIRAAYPNAFLLHVNKGNNVLPLSLCIYIGLPIYLSVYCLSTRKRENMPAMHRILYKPLFYGKVISGREYILVDDVVTQGGTVSSLMHFVTQNGGTVPAILSLAYAKGSRRITPLTENLVKLEQRFGNQLNDFFHEYGMGEDAVFWLIRPETAVRFPG